MDTHENSEPGQPLAVPLQRPVRPRIERLRWYDAQRMPPNSDRTVLVLLRDARPFSQPQWTPGYWDATARLWRDEDMRALPVDTVALYWSEPDGPTVA